MNATLLNQVLIVEDQGYLALALKILLDNDADFHVSGIAHDCPEAVKLMPQAHADLVFVDINLPDDCSGLDLIPRLRRIDPAARFVVYSAEDPAIFSDLARSAGASGFLSKGTSSKRILEVARGIIAGDEFFC